MTQRSIKKVIISSFLFFLFFISLFRQENVFAGQLPDYSRYGDSFSFVLLSDYSKTLPIGGQFNLLAITSSGTRPTFKSSNSSIASVNTYGLVTAKKAGTCMITSKTKNAEAFCILTITPTSITLNKTQYSIENSKSFQLTAQVSTGHKVTWKSNKTSVISVNENGLITAHKVGSATITAKVDGSSATCFITVKPPTISLSENECCLFRKQSIKLTAKTSSGLIPTWKSNKKSVAIVDENGLVTAVKHGTAIITCTLDGVSRTCYITVQQPKITLSKSKLALKPKEKYSISAKVSSGISPEWSSSNINIATVDQNGNITAKEPGKCYIYAVEDGVKVSCIVTVKK